MDRINLYAIYQLGYMVHPIITWKRSTTRGELNESTANLRDRLHMLLDGSPFALPSKKPVKELANAITKALQEGKRDAEGKTWSKKVVTKKEILGIATLARGLQTVLSDRLPLLYSYLVSDTGLFSVDALMMESEKDFSGKQLRLFKSIKKDLGKDIVFDFRQSTSCLACGFYTASGFHIVSASESVLKGWCKVAVKDCDPIEMNWNKCVSALNGVANREKNKKTRERSEAILCVLENFEKTNRNPLMHSDVTLDKEGARTLFGYVRAQISMMSGEILRLKEKP
jgi:hypothetical protein